MLYSKTGSFHHIKYNEQFRKLDQWSSSRPGIFYHHFYDDQQHGVKIINCIDDIHWEFMRSNPDSKLLHENCGETFNMLFVDQIVELLDLRKINPEQIYVLVTDDLHKTFLESSLAEKGILGIHVATYNFLLSNVSLDHYDLPSVKKFSVLSRNYRPARLQLYCSLLEKNLLNDFLYSFYNIHPYEKTVFTVNDMIHDLSSADFPISDIVIDWLYKVPHAISRDDNVYNKWADVTYQTVASTDFHIAIETFFDPFLSHFNGQYKKGYAPNFITEKLYKPIACKKPFIVFGPQYMLEDLRALGYKTFSGFINESYDIEEDPKLRLAMIVAEIERILSLSKLDYQNIVNSIQEICDYNYKILHTKKNEKITDPAFDFIKDHTGWKY